MFKTPQDSKRWCLCVTFSYCCNLFCWSRLVPSCCSLTANKLCPVLSLFIYNSPRACKTLDLNGSFMCFWCISWHSSSSVSVNMFGNLFFRLFLSELLPFLFFYSVVSPQDKQAQSELSAKSALMLLLWTETFHIASFLHNLKCLDKTRSCNVRTPCTLKEQVSLTLIHLCGFQSPEPSDDGAVRSSALLTSCTLILYVGWGRFSFRTEIAKSIWRHAGGPVLTTSLVSRLCFRACWAGGLRTGLCVFYNKLYQHCGRWFKTWPKFFTSVCLIFKWVDSPVEKVEDVGKREKSSSHLIFITIGKLLCDHQGSNHENTEEDV